jgi:glycosyltransferase involved in cell wall biosynthesis
VTRSTNVTHIPLTREIVAAANSYEGAALFTMRANPFNIHAYAYFVGAVLPLVLQACPDFTLRVVGTGCDRVTSVNGVQLVGYVDDLKTEYSTARFFVNPMLGGTGQQVKLVEAMAHGLASVAFGRAAVESPIIHGYSGLVASDRYAFAEHVINLWTDAARRAEFGRNAREHVATHFGRERLREGLNQVVGRLRRVQS